MSKKSVDVAKAKSKTGVSWNKHMRPYGKRTANKITRRYGKLALQKSE